MSLSPTLKVYIWSYHKELYNEVEAARKLGYAISVTSTGAAAAANVSPKPIMNLHNSSARLADTE